jgi:hypothetical protein
LRLKIAEAVGHGPITVVLVPAKMCRRNAICPDIGNRMTLPAVVFPESQLNRTVSELKKNVCIQMYYENFTQFKSAISTFINTAHITHNNDKIDFLEE